MKFHLLAIFLLATAVAVRAADEDEITEIESVEDATSEISYDVTYTYTTQWVTTTPQITIVQNNDWVLVNAEQLQQLLTMFNNQTSVTILNTLTTQTVEQVITYLQTTTVSVSDWEFVFHQLYGKMEAEWVKVLNLGASLNFGSNKFVYYTALLNFLESQQTDQQIAEIWKARPTVGPNFNFDLVIKYNPLFAFLKFEQQLLNEMRNIIVDALAKEQLIAHQLFNQIQWNVIWELYNDKYQDKPFPLQVIVIETVEKHWFKLNLAAIIGQLDKIPNDTENNKIKKLLFYIALFEAAHKNLGNKADNYLLLVLSFEEFINGLTLGTGNAHGQTWINRIKNKYHGCAKFVIGKTQNQLYSIENRHFKEYLYAVVPNIKPEKPKGWRTTPKGMNKDTYRPAFTWREETIANKFDDQFKWFVEHTNRRFWIRNGEYTSLYLDTTHPTHVHMTRADSKLDKLAVWFIPSPLDKDACYIRNYHKRNAIYAGANNVAEDVKRRTVFTRNGCQNRAYLWYIRDYKSNIV